MIIKNEVNTRAKRAYFDNGATTKTDPEVVNAMLPYFTEDYGNPSSIHSLGIKAREAINESRIIIAKALNAKPQELIFTSGGTESDNLAIKGITQLKGKGHVITSNIEHPAVLKTCEALGKQGFKITYLPVNNEGLITPEQVSNAITKETILVTIMHANNEIGTIQPIKEIHEVCKKHNIPLHTDAVQSFTKEPITLQDADLISISAHKIHGPKGVGALCIKEGIKLANQNIGGSHEQGLRAGTENVPGIIGFAKAVANASNQGIKELRDYLISELLKIPHSWLNGSITQRLINNVNITFNKVEGESLLLLLDDKGISVSTGSACSSHSLKPSHVLTALGLKPEQSHGSIRITLSKYTTREECDYLINNIKEAVKKLRELSPL